VTRELIRDRLTNQKLVDSRLATPQDVVAWQGAVQAQDFAGAKWALGLRARGLGDADVERAFNDGAILRTHVLRPTWHFVTPADIRWLLTLSAPRVHAANRSVYRKYELDAKTFSRSRTVLERALKRKTFLTRDELAAALERAGISADRIRLAYVVIHAELEQVICSGPRRGKQFTYALLDERAPRVRPISSDESLARLSERYFSSHGPATIRDYVWWSGLTVRQATTGIELVKPSLERIEIDHLTYWRAPAPARVRKVPALSGAFLLPNYDEYLIAYRDRDGVVEPALARRWGAAGPEAYAHPVVVDGRFAGVWRRAVKRDAVVVEVTPYRALKVGERKSVEEATERYGRFLRLKACLVFKHST
jgi:Winged helix DNA-binding domain